MSSELHSLCEKSDLVCMGVAQKQLPPKPMGLSPHVCPAQKRTIKSCTLRFLFTSYSSAAEGFFSCPTPCTNVSSCRVKPMVLGFGIVRLQMVDIYIEHCNAHNFVMLLVSSRNMVPCKDTRCDHTPTWFLAGRP